MLKTFLKINTKSVLCVDFNRAYAPFIQDIKKVVSGRTNPMAITYRMNIGYLPQDHWIQNEYNRGRIVGEACHIFDLFCFLTDARPVSISVLPLHNVTKDMFLTDNFSVTLRMSDGSCCSLLSSALGNAGMGKEYMEILFDGKSIVMNDFFELRGYGLPKSFNKKYRIQDKGHEQLLRLFFNAAQYEDQLSPISHERSIMATELTLKVDKLVREGGGFEIIS